MAEESLDNDSVNAVLLHPLEMQVDDSLASVVVELHWLAVGCCQGRGEQAVGRILADIGHKLEFNYNHSCQQQFFNLNGP